MLYFMIPRDIKILYTSLKASQLLKKSAVAHSTRHIIS